MRQVFFGPVASVHTGGSAAINALLFFSVSLGLSRPLSLSPSPPHTRHIVYFWRLFFFSVLPYFLVFSFFFFIGSYFSYSYLFLDSLSLHFYSVYNSGIITNCPVAARSRSSRARARKSHSHLPTHTYIHQVCYLLPPAAYVLCSSFCQRIHLFSSRDGSSCLSAFLASLSFTHTLFLSVSLLSLSTSIVTFLCLWFCCVLHIASAVTPLPANHRARAKLDIRTH